LNTRQAAFILYVFKLIQLFAEKNQESQDNFDCPLLKLFRVLAIVNSVQSGQSACGDKPGSSTGGPREFCCTPVSGMLSVKMLGFHKGMESFGRKAESGRNNAVPENMNYGPPVPSDDTANP
jgi:hypothetical protein